MTDHLEAPVGIEPTNSTTARLVSGGDSLATPNDSKEFAAPHSAPAREIPSANCNETATAGGLTKNQSNQPGNPPVSPVDADSAPAGPDSNRKQLTRSATRPADAPGGAEASAGVGARGCSESNANGGVSLTAKLYEVSASAGRLRAKRLQLAAAIREERTRQGIGVRELAKRMGVSAAALSTYERGQMTGAAPGERVAALAVDVLCPPTRPGCGAEVTSPAGAAESGETTDRQRRVLAGRCQSRTARREHRCVRTEGHGGEHSHPFARSIDVWQRPTEVTA